MIRLFLILALLTPATGLPTATNAGCGSDTELEGHLRRVLPIDPTIIDYTRRGNPAAPKIVLVPGNMDSWTTFGPIIDDLAKDFDVIAISPRGHGQTPASGWNYTPRQMGDDVIRFLDYLGIEKAHFVGHSLGARTIVDIAVNAPERVLSLTAEDMPATRLNFDARHESFRMAKAIANLPRTFRSQANARAQLGAILGDAWASSLNRQFGMEMQGGGWGFSISIPAYLIHASQAAFWDMTPNLSKISAPVLVIGGDPAHGALLTEEGAAAWNCPRVTRVRIAGAGHYIHREKTEEFLRVLRGFLNPPASSI